MRHRKLLSVGTPIDLAKLLAMLDAAGLPDGVIVRAQAGQLIVEEPQNENVARGGADPQMSENARIVRSASNQVLGYYVLVREKGEWVADWSGLMHVTWDDAAVDAKDAAANGFDSVVCAFLIQSSICEGEASCSERATL